MAEFKRGDRVLVPAEVDEVATGFVFIKGSRYQFDPAEVVPSNSAQISELRYLREREAHFAKVLGIPDGGRYRHDWDATLEVVREIATLRQQGHISLAFTDSDRYNQACAAFDALARLLPETQP